MRKFNKLGLFICLLSSLFLLVGCSTQKKTSQNSSRSTKVWRVAANDNLQSMDTSTFFDQNSMQAVNNVMEGLYRYQGKKLIPALSTSIVEPSNNGLTYTFKLRKDATWSNGDPVSADDFVFAWQRTVDPATKAQYAYLYSGIKNADAIMKGQKSPKTLGITKVDQNTFKVTLEHQIPYFDSLMTNTPFFPQNKKIVEKYGKEYGTSSDKTVYNGAFTLTKWNGTNGSWTLVKNSNYWNKKNVHLDKIKYQVVKDPTTALNLFDSKQLDDVVISGVLAKERKNSSDRKDYKLTRTMYLTFNQGKDKLLKNEKIRSAISLAINRDDLTKDILADGSFPAHNLVPEGLTDFPNTKKDFTETISAKNSNYSTYNLNKAKELWKSGLAEEKVTNVNWTMLGEDNDLNKKLMEFFQGQLEKLPGLTININSVPHKTRLDLGQKGDFDLMTSQVGADFPDPVAILNVQVSDNVYNFGKTNNATYDKLIKESNDLSDPTARFNKLKEAQEILTKEQDVAPIYQLVETHLTRSNLKNVQFSPNNLFNYIGATLDN